MTEPGTNQMANQCPQCGLSLPPGALEGLCPACLLKEATTESATEVGNKPFEPPGVPELTRLFPQLEILTLLGKGGMGAVYKARQPDLDRFVALKILPSETGAGSAERFTREARALARLSHFGRVDGLNYFIMEYVDGTWTASISGNWKKGREFHRVKRSRLSRRYATPSNMPMTKAWCTAT
jgi:hypothetical protein